MVRVLSVEWPEGLTPGSQPWDAIRGSLADKEDAVLVTNEMPFGGWMPTQLPIDTTKAAAWADLHVAALEALSALPVRAVISSRPVLVGEKLVNEAFALVDGRYQFLHQKHYFPSENGWQEAGWFGTERHGFDVAPVAGLRVGVLLCTELMFLERARELGKKGADLIAVPRATGTDLRPWRTAASMAGIVSGACVISSNRVGHQNVGSPHFGGGGILVDSDGFEIAVTSPSSPMVSFDVDVTLTEAAKHRYPVYVKDV